MSIIETIKGLFGSKAAEMANNVSGATANVTNSVTEKVINKNDESHVCGEGEQACNH